MKLAYYPGCTLKTKALGLEDSALRALRVLGAPIVEMPRWNCCGAVFSLADDDLIHQIAPTRNLICAMEIGADTIVTLCSQCYNTLARADLLMRENQEKRDTINRFMDEEPDYDGSVRVVHYLTFLRDYIGFDKVKKMVKVPLKNLKVAPFYGCTLIRPEEVAIAGVQEELFEEYLGVLGAQVVDFKAKRECCGSYQALAHEEAEADRIAAVLKSVNESGANAIALSCPMCEYNLGTNQGVALANDDSLESVPTYYFTQLLAIALGLEPETCHFELSRSGALALLKDKEYIASDAV